MVALTLTLRSSAARRSNLVVTRLFTVISIGDVLGETWSFYWLGAALERAQRTTS